MDSSEVDPVAALVERLRAAGCVFAEDEAAVLLDAAGLDGAQLERLVAARVAGAPLEHVVGFVDFAGVRVLLDPGVFVPRQRTALMVETAIDHLRAGSPAIVVDLGCGSGALAAAVLAAVPSIEVYAVDVDPAAVGCARRNLPTGRVRQGDLYDALPVGLRGRVGVQLANGPYVPTGEIARLPTEARDHEHRIALDGGSDGLDVLRRVLDEAADWLIPGGLVLVECGEPQLATCMTLVAGAGLDPTVVRDDERGALIVTGHRRPARLSGAAL